MTDKKPELSDAMKKKLEPRKFIKNPILGTKFTIAISSAKGGVGKSTFATNLALALKKAGCKVGLLDADIYGPSLPKLFSINEKPKSEDGKALIPLEKYNVQCMSMGFLVDEQTPMIWRGPMVISALKTMTQKVLWKDRDVIVIDMPPGTGDAYLTVCQKIVPDFVILVSTISKLSIADLRRSEHVFASLNTKILGIILNNIHQSDNFQSFNLETENLILERIGFNKKFIDSTHPFDDLELDTVFINTIKAIKEHE